MLLKPLLINVIETALNQYLSLDEDVAEFLQPLAGKVIEVKVLSPLSLNLFVCPTERNIQLLDQYTEAADTVLTGSASALGLMGLSSKPMNSVFSGKVTIEGDLETGRKFQELFDKLDIDLEEKLSQFTGDIIAHKISHLFRQGQRWSKDSITTFKLNSIEFLQDETHDLPAPPEVEIFFRQVDEIRSEFDRLCSRINRLNSLLQEHA